jgi:Sap, sulfolipid-1-addressing protein
VSQAVALAVFIVIATLGVGAPVAIYYLMGDRATSILGGLHDWMARENAAIMAVICLIIGAKTDRRRSAHSQASSPPTLQPPVGSRSVASSHPTGARSA